MLRTRRSIRATRQKQIYFHSDTLRPTKYRWTFRQGGFGNHMTRHHGLQSPGMARLSWSTHSSRALELAQGCPSNSTTRPDAATMKQKSLLGAGQHHHGTRYLQHHDGPKSEEIFQFA
eukprot:5850023-Pleurochrysis_carterae.AAC.4